MSPSLLLVSLLAQVAPVIRADGTDGCPHAAAVSQRLAGLLGDAGEPGAPDVVQLSVAGNELLVRLSRADGTLVAERLIPRSKRCAELADAAAALVAAWESDLRPAGVPLPPPLPPPLPAPAPPSVPAPPPPPPVPSAQPPLLLQSTSPRTDRQATYELGALPALWLGGGQFSFAGALRAGVWSRRAPVGMTISASATFPVDGGDSAGLARWRRLALSGGVMGRLQHRWLFVDGLAEAVLGWLVVDQEGTSDGTRASFDPGLTIGLRAGSRVARRLELYASLAAWGAAWNRPATPGMRASAVPHWGLLTGLGASILFF